jgi:hypothetical protein
MLANDRVMVIRRGFGDQYYVGDYTRDATDASIRPNRPDCLIAATDIPELLVSTPCTLVGDWQPPEGWQREHEFTMIQLDSLPLARLICRLASARHQEQGESCLAQSPSPNYLTDASAWRTNKNL